MVETARRRNSVVITAGRSEPTTDTTGPPLISSGNRNLSLYACLLEPESSVTGSSGRMKKGAFSSLFPKATCNCGQILVDIFKNLVLF